VAYGDGYGQELEDMVACGMLCGWQSRRLRDKGEKGYMMPGKQTKRQARTPQRPNKGRKGTPPPLVLSDVIDSLPKGKMNRNKGLLGWVGSYLECYVNLKAIWGRLRGRAVKVGGGEGRPPIPSVGAGVNGTTKIIFGLSNFSAQAVSSSSN